MYADLRQRRGEARIAGEPDAVGVQHHQLDTALPWPGRSISRIWGWIDGSPPESWTASGSPSAATKRVEHRLDLLERQREAVSCGPVPESAKQIGQSRLQAVLTSMIPRQVCWACSGQIPQSWGQPSATSVWRSSGCGARLVEALDLQVRSASP